MRASSDSTILLGLRRVQINGRARPEREEPARKTPTEDLVDLLAVFAQNLPCHHEFQNILGFRIEVGVLVLFA